MWAEKLIEMEEQHIRAPGHVHIEWHSLHGSLPANNRLK
jgi:hypothetical protein